MPFTSEKKILFFFFASQDCRASLVLMTVGSSTVKKKQKTVVLSRNLSHNPKFIAHDDPSDESWLLLAISRNRGHVSKRHCF